ncbi:MAG: 3-dehydroquinate synthase [Flavobacterium sp. BFFFF1]|uniref:3-dehydroquinate synthase n=1 Tax=Flavobacterium sp. BFFFF1 TaxID=2015557 RepID=UPI000BDB695B|nr:3-dehydroquinate synthase [Flavobacterium sp. BFFFF1]OYU81755.1 MAG: 3-dehydroquinate synthase [Flavobacterium sp. BFFFF1]
MQTIHANGYEILFGDGGYDAVNRFIADRVYSKIFILTDTNSNEYCLPRFLSFLATEVAIEIIEVDAGEMHKNIETCIGVWNALTELGADRKSLMINLGGGVVTDLGGFVASTFKRGIDFTHIPTTLLAMVDASVGGKNGIDLGNLKNHIGVINTPRMILMDMTFLDTLPQIEMRSGLAEMLKHGLIYDKNYWDKFTDLAAIDTNDLGQLIYESVVIKNEIVAADPNEKGIRKSLNFGHTLGHAIEGCFLENESKTTLLHGEAIAAGMVLESHLSLQKGLISAEEYAAVKRNILGIYGRVTFDANDLQSITDLLIHDKKNEYGKIQFVLLDGIGSVKIGQELDNESITNAFEDYKS